MEYFVPFALESLHHFRYGKQGSKYKPTGMLAEKNTGCFIPPCHSLIVWVTDDSFFLILFAFFDRIHSSWVNRSILPRSELVFLSPARRGPRVHPFKVLQGASHRRRRGSAFSVRVVKYWNKFPASVVTAPSINVFKKRLEKVWIEVFPHPPHWLKCHPASRRQLGIF